MANDEIILSTSDDAATFRTDISGWVSRDGIFYGKDERTARYAGCTHRPCNDCGKPVEKSSGWTLCDECRQKKEDALFASYKKQEWDGETPLTLFRGDDYFFDMDSLMDYCDEHETTPDKLQLLICEPNYAREIDNDYYCDDLPEDQSLEDVAPELAALIDSVNKYIYEHKPILSWGPSKIAAIIPESK